MYRCIKIQKIGCIELQKRNSNFFKLWVSFIFRIKGTKESVTITFAEVPIAGFPNAEKKASLVRFFITDRTHKLDSKNWANILNILGTT